MTLQLPARHGDSGLLAWDGYGSSYHHIKGGMVSTYEQAIGAWFAAMMMAGYTFPKGSLPALQVSDTFESMYLSPTRTPHDRMTWLHITTADMVRILNPAGIPCAPSLFITARSVVG